MSDFSMIIAIVQDFSMNIGITVSRNKILLTFHVSRLINWSPSGTPQASARILEHTDEVRAA